MPTNIRRYYERNLPITSQSPIVLNDEVLTGDTNGGTSIQLAGYRAMGYERSLQESLVWILESFSGVTPPPKAIKGQLWYKSDDKLLYVYDGDDYLDGGDSTNINNWVKPINIDISDLTAHITDYANPHQVTKAQVGLSDVVNGLQLLASNNLSDLTNPVTARNNLGVYDKAYIDANFLPISGGNDSNTVGGISSTQFIRADINDDVDGTLTYKNAQSIKTSYDSGIPFTFASSTVGDQGDIKVGVNKGKYKYCTVAGINFNELSTNINEADMFRLYKKSGTNGSGAWETSASIIGILTESNNIDEGGVYIGVDGYGAANNDILSFPKMLHVGANYLKWGTDKVVTDAGFDTLGVIKPASNASVDGTTGVDLGAPLRYFRSVYSRNTNTTNIYCDTTAESSIDENSEIAFRNNSTSDNKMRFITRELLQNYLGIVNSQDQTTQDGVPVGSIIYFATSTPPTGYLVADGSEHSKDSYQQLSVIVGSHFGAASSPSKFKLPNLLGVFIRGWDGSRGLDVGREFGSYQEDEFKSHTHGVHTTASDQAGGGGLGDIPGSSMAVLSGATGGSETRPKNVALLPCIKAIDIALPPRIQPLTPATYTGSSSYVFTHTLGSSPSIVFAKLKCTDAGGDAGYAQNDVIQFPFYADDATTKGATMLISSSSITIKVATNGIDVVDKTGAGTSTLTASKWQIQVSVFG